MSWGTDTLVFAVVAVGAITQRMTGLGFALVAAPLLVVVAGAVDGVLIGNALSVVLCIVVLSSTWRSTRWRRAGLLILPALVTVPLGAYVALHLPAALLLIAVGTIALLAVGLAAVSGRVRLLPGAGGAIVAGGLGGFMNATAGVGGPMLAVHAFSERWPRDVFVGTGQVFLLAVNVLSLASKGVPSVALDIWASALVALAAGVFVGGRIGSRIPEATGRRLVLCLAAAGSVSAIVRGMSNL